MNYYIDVNGSKQNAMKRKRGRRQSSKHPTSWHCGQMSDQIPAATTRARVPTDRGIGGLQSHTNVHNCFHILHDFMVSTHCCVTFLTYYQLIPCPGYGKLFCTTIPHLHDIFKLSLRFCYYFSLSPQMAAALCSYVIFL
jgi:hypothetical protein